MIKTLIAIGLIATSVVGPQGNASELALKGRYEHHFDKLGWSLYPHGKELIAFNRDSLQIEILNAATGASLSVDSLDSRGQRPRLLETLSDSKGEFLITFVREDNSVELHAVNNPVSWEVQASAKPISLQLVEGKKGEVFLIVATRNNVSVYRRADTHLQSVRVLTTKIGYQQVQAMRSITGLLVLSLWDKEGRIHGIQLGDNGVPHEHVTLGRQAARVQSIVDGRTNDYVTALVAPGEFRFYVEGEKDDSEAYPMDAKLGAGKWFKGPTGRSLFAAVHRGADQAAELTILDPYGLAEAVNFSVGDAISITDVGGLQVRHKSYYYFVRDHRYLYIQNDDEVSAIQAKAGEKIVSVQFAPAAKALAVLLESENGTRLRMVGAN